MYMYMANIRISVSPPLVPHIHFTALLLAAGGINPHLRSHVKSLPSSSAALANPVTILVQERGRKRGCRREEDRGRWQERKRVGWQEKGRERGGKREEERGVAARCPCCASTLLF
jgi:hypothetical protein